MTVTQQVPGSAGRDRDGAETDFVSTDRDTHLDQIANYSAASHRSSPRQSSMYRNRRRTRQCLHGSMRESR